MQAENEFWVYGHKSLQGLFPIVYLNKGRNNLWAKSEGGVNETSSSKLSSSSDLAHYSIQSLYHSLDQEWE